MNGQLPLRSRLIIGALAGVVGTAVMTAAMSRAHRLLPKREQYPLPPREITEAILAPKTDENAKDLATVVHFAFGAGGGAAIAAVNPKANAASGGGAGLALWAVSYLGWLPGLNLLTPATSHPLRRNLLMMGVHLIWGAATVTVLHELKLARGTTFRAGPSKDQKAEQGESGGA